VVEPAPLVVIESALWMAAATGGFRTHASRPRRRAIAFAPKQSRRRPLARHPDVADAMTRRQLT
jgi:hypothetical protein